MTSKSLRSTTILFLILVIIIIISCSEHSQAPIVSETDDPNEFSKTELDLILNQYVKEKHFMGSVNLRVAGMPVYSFESGYSDYKNNIHASSDTKYRIGSITKTFTAVLVMMAVEERKLTLKQTLNQFYPDITYADKITMAHLLNHRSGIPSYTKHSEFKELAYRDVSQSDMLKLITSYGSEFEPGARWSYSNSNYYLLTMILESLYKTTYAKLIEKKISHAHGLSNTYYTFQASPLENEAYSYQDSNYTLEPTMHHSISFGAGGMVSTTEDLTKFLELLFKGKIIKESLVQKMIDTSGSYGFGLEKFGFYGKSSIGHGGRIDAFNSIAFFMPEEEISLAIVDNSVFEDTSSMAKDILSTIFADDIHKTDTTELIKFVGQYRALTPGDSSITEFEKHGDTLMVVIAGEFREALIYQGNNRFLFDQSHAPAITFIFSAEGKELIFEQNKVQLKYRKIH